MADLHLALKGEYFDAIKAGTKTEEYRMRCDFWSIRIEGRDFQRIVLTRGYPKKTDWSRRIVLPWRGYTVKTIVHPHFGNVPIEVFAIDVSGMPQISNTAIGSASLKEHECLNRTG